MKEKNERYLNDDEVLLHNFDDGTVVEDVAVDHSSFKRFPLLLMRRKKKWDEETEEDPLSILRIQRVLSCIFEQIGAFQNIR